jgi:hypothetical protein
VIHPGNLLASSLVPNLAFRDQSPLEGHSTDKNRTDGNADERQLPTPHHSPEKAHAYHGHNDNELAHDDC